MSELRQSRDTRWMEEALRLARRGEGHTRPNPPVGAIVVRRERCVGRGWHRRAGAPHAEVVALRAAGERAAGADLYVTLEPCNTHGRTPPCTEAIKAAGISRVIVGATDPNPLHAGRGLRTLSRAGVAIRRHVAGEAARALIAPFSKWITTRRPHVTLKLAATLDGRIADARGRSRWITSPPARALVQDLRRRADVMLVGARTAMLDNPSLLCRTHSSRDLYRVVVDSRGTVPVGLQLFTDGKGAGAVLATTAACPPLKAAAHARAGTAVWTLPAAGGHVSLKTLMRRLGREGMLHVVCEGGGQLAEALIRAGLVDELLYFIAPKLLGAAGTPVVGGGWPLAHAPGLVFQESRRIGDDLMIRAVTRGRGEG